VRRKGRDIGYADALGAWLALWLARQIYLVPLFCLFDLVASANSTSRRIASERDGLSGSCLAQLSIAALSESERRMADTGSCPVAGRPLFFRTTGIDFLLITVLRKIYNCTT
jgi:hypothetical protein